MFRPCECCQRCCEFLYVSIYSLMSSFHCIFLQQKCNASLLLPSFCFLVHNSLTHEGRGLMRTRIKDSVFQGLSFSEHYLVVHLCMYSSLLPQEASIMLSERETKYENDRMLLEVILLLCSFGRAKVFGFLLGPCLTIPRFLATKAESDMDSI